MIKVTDLGQMWALLQKLPLTPHEGVTPATFLTVPVFLLQEIFLFITRQLKGLEDTKSPQFNRYFYLLEVWS